MEGTSRICLEASWPDRLVRAGRVGKVEATPAWGGIQAFEC